LVKALLAHPNVVDEVIPRGRADFEFLLRQVGDELMSEQEWEALPREPVVGPPLAAGYPGHNRGRMGTGPGCGAGGP
jgi:hypothetical protein